MMILNIELPIVYNSDDEDETGELFESLGITSSSEDKIPLKDLPTKPITFYVINCISIYLDPNDKTEDHPKGVEYAIVQSNGDSFICKHDYKTLQRIISEHISKTKRLDELNRLTLKSQGL